jgi:hypothetical protein
MTGIRVDLTPEQRTQASSGSVSLNDEQARAVMGKLLSASGSGRPRSTERCACGQMTRRRAEARGHKCT